VVNVKDSFSKYFIAAEEVTDIDPKGNLHDHNKKYHRSEDPRTLVKKADHSKRYKTGSYIQELHKDVSPVFECLSFIFILPLHQL
jgi:hypothetical protein